MFKTFDVKIDIEKDLYSPMQILFNVSNSDNSVEVFFELLQDDIPFDLTGKTIQLAVQDPAQKVFYQDVLIEDPTQGKASVKLSQDAYQGVGLHISEIYIRDVDNTIVTSPFYFYSRESIVQSTVETPVEGSVNISWADVLNKPSFFPPELHNHQIADVVGLQTALDGMGGGVPADHTHEILDVIGLQPALDGKADDLHSHAIADVTGLQIALNEKSELNHAHGVGEITGLQNALDGKVDDAQLGTKADLEHNHAILDVTGLQTALDGKADNIDLDAKADKNASYLKTETYSKTELYNRTEIDQMTMGAGGGSPVIVEDNLVSISPTNALSSNQGRILDETKADLNHVHDLADVTGLQTELNGKASINHTHPEYADVNHTHLEYASADHTHGIIDVTGLQTELDGKANVIHNHDLDYSPILHSHGVGDITGLATTLDAKADVLDLDAKADVVHTHTYAEIEGKPLSFPPDAHVHTILDVTGLQTALDGKADNLDLDAKADVNHNHDLSYAPINHTHPENAPAVHNHAIADVTGLQTALDGKADDVHSHAYDSLTGIPTTFTPPLASGLQVGGARVGNGLAMSGEYMTVRSGTGLITSPTTYSVEVDRTQTDDWYVKNATGQNLTIWKGTQLEYDAIGTPSASTLYFIVG